MLKENEVKLNELADSENSLFGSELVSAILHPDDDPVIKKAMTATGGGATAWDDMKDELLTIVGFDIIRSNVRVYEKESPNQFKKLSEVNGVEVTDDGTNRKYTTREIAYVAALTKGARPSISLTTLQSYAKNKKIAGDLGKGKKVLSLTAPTSADYLANHAEALLGKTLRVVGCKKGKNGNSAFETQVVAFEITEPAK